MDILKEQRSDDDTDDARAGKDDEHDINGKRRRSTAGRRKSNKGAPNQAQKDSQKLAAGWRIVNERLKDIEALEKKNKSQIKYEVDKAFEMAKYLDDTNFTSRDPATS